MVAPLGVLSLGMTFVTFVYASIGLIGYVTYGENVEDSITLNLPQNKFVDIVFFFLNIFLRLFLSFQIIWTVIVYFTYLIQQYVIIEMTWPYLKKKLNLEKIELNNENCNNSLTNNNNNESDLSIEKSRTESIITVSTMPIITDSRLAYPIELLYRTLIVIITMCVGIAVPNLKNIISLVGFTSGMFLAFIIPASIDTILFLPAHIEKNGGKFNSRALFILIRNSILFLVGFCGSIFGLKISIEAILSLKK